LPHSEIHGSQDACSSPWLIAACHVLLRLPAPRHPPCALTTLDQFHFPMDRSTGTHSIAYQRSSSRRIPITRIVKYRGAPEVLCRAVPRSSRSAPQRVRDGDVTGTLKIQKPPFASTPCRARLSPAGDRVKCGVHHGVYGVELLSSRSAHERNELSEKRGRVSSGRLARTFGRETYSYLQKGGDPAAGSPTATLLRLRPSHRTCLRPLPPCG
jgi:hypothetical protein